MGGSRRRKPLLSIGRNALGQHERVCGDLGGRQRAVLGRGEQFTDPPLDPSSTFRHGTMITLTIAKIRAVQTGTGAALSWGLQGLAFASTFLVCCLAVPMSELTKPTEDISDGRKTRKIASE